MATLVHNCFYSYFGLSFIYSGVAEAVRIPAVDETPECACTCRCREDAIGGDFTAVDIPANAVRIPAVDESPECA